MFLLAVCLRLQARRAAVIGWRPRLADLYAEVEQARGDSFRADWRITDLIRHAERCGAPDPGVVCPDDGLEFTALEEQVRAALAKEPQGARTGTPRRPRAVRRLHRSQLMTITRCAEVSPPGSGPPLHWMKEMTMTVNPTALLLDLAARAQSVTAPDTLHDLLSAGHRAWCEGVADVRAGVDRETASLSDALLAERCATAGAPWEKEMTRSEAVSALAFVTWEAAPAAMAYTALEERAARFGVCLLDEEVL
ncbi:hypothetical protein ABZ904_29050 [Streptomyces sp. NPDC046900]|uniref:hypothetical protein n=1 Tax=Streptomyces sp. NPDC046900 TaxID=3155473 RepID=UPI0033F16BF6